MDDVTALYFATKQIYADEARRSAETLRKHHPRIRLSIAASSDVDVDPMFKDVHIIEDPAHGFADSVPRGDWLPDGKALLVDSDTYFAHPISGVSEVLDRVDVAAAHDPKRTGSVDHELTRGITDAHPQHNTGLVGLSGSPESRDFVEHWRSTYEHTIDLVEYGLNQPAFRLTTWGHPARIATLPPEYNWRMGNVANHVLYACGPVRVLHGRAPTRWTNEELIEHVNSTHEPRVVNANTWPPQIIVEGDRGAYHQTRYLIDRFMWRRRKFGWADEIKGAASRVLGR